MTFQIKSLVSWVSPKLTEVLPCKLGKALSLWSEAVLEGLALLYLTCHESELLMRTRGEIMDEGGSRFRQVRSISCSLDIRVIRRYDDQGDTSLGSELLLVREST